MKSNYVRLFCILATLGYFSGFLNAQELTPPAWSVGNWWIVKSQVYDSGKVVAGRTPRWSAPQSWYFSVEAQDFIANQPYFVVLIRPLEENPFPYWLRCWFRISDRYIARYELYHLKSLSGTKMQNFGAPVVRKDFDPQEAVPFLTTKFPTLPITVPVFTEVIDRVSNITGTQRMRDPRSPRYSRSEFQANQEIQVINAKILSEKANPEFLNIIGKLSTQGNLAITIRTTTSIVEEQYWNPQVPWCVYGTRTENSVVSRRYWLVEVGEK